MSESVCFSWFMLRVFIRRVVEISFRDRFRLTVTVFLLVIRLLFSIRVNSVCVDRAYEFCVTLVLHC